ncbi:MAG: SDR family NAD(P)-dependent oxidoreductase [Dehalococcoidia bacterium]|nr:SDR family NAD(P)-dependent oxidoreductase [Dehalococcoidia bacterium]
MGKLDGKVAVITGSGRGIGKATAELFCKEGASVVINDIDQKVVDETVAEIKKAGGKVVGCQADITKPDQCQKLMDTAAESFGKLDILVNNAGLTRDGVIHKMTDEMWDQCVNISLKGTFNCIRAAAKYMRKENHNGRIINVSSMAAVRGNPGQANYASAKGGIIALTKVIGREWENFGVTCNCVAYGPVDTRLTKSAESQDEVVGGVKLGIPAKARDNIMEKYHGKIMQPADAAWPIFFFATPEAWCINGNCIQAAIYGFN